MWQALFDITNAIALIGWALLILLPRLPQLALLPLLLLLILLIQ